MSKRKLKEKFSCFLFLRHGGDVTWMNDKKESIVDLASKQNCPDLMQAIASHRGQQMIDRQMKIYDDQHNHHYDDYARNIITDGHRSS